MAAIREMWPIAAARRYNLRGQHDFRPFADGRIWIAGKRVGDAAPEVSGFAPLGRCHPFRSLTMRP